MRFIWRCHEPRVYGDRFQLQPRIGTLGPDHRAKARTIGQETITRERLKEEAMRSWRRAALAIGTPPDAYTPHVLKVRIKDSISRIVMLFQSLEYPDLVLKQSYPPEHINHFRNGVQAHQRAASLLRDHPDLDVPALRHVDEETCTILMDHVPGRTVHDLLDLAELGLEDRHQVLGQAGRWIRAYHDATHAGTRQLNPTRMLEHADRMIGNVRSGSHLVPRRREFLKFADCIHPLAEAVRNREIHISATHGDLHLRNIMIHGQRVTGLDFGSVHNAPVGHDLARFLVNLGNFFHDPAPESQGGFLDGADATAFFAGYGPEFQHDPALTYLFPIQILTDWCALPKQRVDRNPLHQRRLKGVLLLTRHARG